MTLREFFEKIVLPTMAERQDAADTYEETYPAVINSVLADCFALNNGILQSQGKEPLPAVVFYGVEDEIPYDQGLLLNCINYGVAARLLVDEAGDEGATVGFLESLYNQHKEDYKPCLYESVSNIWGGGNV